MRREETRKEKLTSELKEQYQEIDSAERPSLDLFDVDAESKTESVLDATVDIEPGIVELHEAPKVVIRACKDGKPVTISAFEKQLVYSK